MAKIDVIMPQMGESIAEGTLSRWIKKVGDAVKRDEPIFEISTDKVDAEIPAPAAGTLAAIPGSGLAGRVTKNDILGYLERGAAGQPAGVEAPAPERPAAAGAPSPAAR